MGACLLLFSCVFLSPGDWDLRKSLLDKAVLTMLTHAICLSVYLSTRRDVFLLIVSWLVGIFVLFLYFSFPTALFSISLCVSACAWMHVTDLVLFNIRTHTGEREKERHAESEKNKRFAHVMWRQGQFAGSANLLSLEAANTWPDAREILCKASVTLPPAHLSWPLLTTGHSIVLMPSNLLASVCWVPFSPRCWGC